MVTFSSALVRPSYEPVICVSSVNELFLDCYCLLTFLKSAIKYSIMCLIVSTPLFMCTKRQEGFKVCSRAVCTTLKTSMQNVNVRLRKVITDGQ